MHPVELKFQKIMSRSITSETRVLVAVSGGPDSVVLLHLLNKYKIDSSNNSSLAIAHLNHLARGVDSNNDSDFVVGLGKTLGVETFVEDADVALLASKKKTSFQESARIIRYDFLERISKKWRADLVALGHNSDDQAETFLINLLRGSGLRGLTGIRSRRGNYIRPLCDCSRQEIENYISTHTLQFRLDKSNKEKYYLRNKVRLDLIPSLELYNSNIKNSLVSTSRLLADDEDYIEKKVEMAMAQVEFEVKGDNFASLDVSLFNSQHPALQKRLIRHAILAAKGDLRSISVRHVLKIIQMTKLENGVKEIHLPGFLTASCEKGRLFVYKRPRCDFNEGEFFLGDFVSKAINIPGTTEIGSQGLCLKTKLVSKKDIDFFSTNLNKAYLDYDKTGSVIKVRVFRPGDRFIPLGMTGTKKLKAFFIDEKVPRNQRRSIPLLTSINDDIIWVYKKRIGEPYRVTDKSTRVMVIEGTIA